VHAPGGVTALRWRAVSPGRGGPGAESQLRAGDDRLVSEEERDPESRAVERLMFFSDAVAAIAITLLALDLPVPEGDTVSAFWSSVQRSSGHYAAFLISFAVIAMSWGGHHDVFRYIRRADPRLRTLNMAWLLTIVLNPFATRLLTARGHPSPDVHALRFGFYALLLVLQSGALLALLRHMVSHGLAPGAPQPAVTSMTRQCYVLIVGFGLSIPLFYVTTGAWLLWILVPLLAGRGIRLWHRAAHG
jgi:uncharacterized membrane protein